MAQASRKGSRRGQSGPKGVQGVGSQNVDEALDRDDLADDIQGRNELQGHDQSSVRNQRRTQPHGSNRTEGVVESFERSDPKARGGNRSGKS